MTRSVGNNVTVNSLSTGQRATTHSHTHTHTPAFYSRHNSSAAQHCVCTVAKTRHARLHSRQTNQLGAGCQLSIARYSATYDRA